MVERAGRPRAVCLSGANRPDAQVFTALLDRIPPLKQPRGRPGRRPDKLHADKAYDHRPGRAALHRRPIKVRIARKGSESSTTLGRHRWVAERTFSWLSDFRRLAVRYERRDDIHLAFLHLGCALICERSLPAE